MTCTECLGLQLEELQGQGWTTSTCQASLGQGGRRQYLKLQFLTFCQFPLEVGGQDIYDYMREIYQDQIPLFVEGFNKIMARTNGNVTHTINMFSTKYLDKIFEGFF